MATLFQTTSRLLLKAPRHPLIAPSSFPYSTMPPSQPKPGETLTGKFQIGESDLASAISPDPVDVYARVFATPRMIAFMEIVCARMLYPYQKKGQLSVGARIDATHSAATLPGAEVSVTAKFVEMKGKSYVFDVVASDPAGEIGKATHERAIIDEERLYKGADKRKASSKM